jgi:hypothetical protein
VPLRLLAGLDRMPGVAIIALQRGDGLAELTLPGPRPAVVNPEGAPADIAATAAMILEMDLVITVDTMVAHLAGALGVPVWTLLHFTADWRWMIGREDSPWYPTMRLFRQPRPGAWTPVIERVVDALDRLLMEREAAPRHWPLRARGQRGIAS